jgi:hypothetical protein
VGREFADTDVRDGDGCVLHAVFSFCCLGDRDLECRRETATHGITKERTGKWERGALFFFAFLPSLGLERAR